MVHKSKTLQPGRIYSLGKYYKYRIVDEDGDRIVNPKFNQHCRHILNIKEGRQDAVKNFFGRLDPELEADIAIAVVPSHQAGKTDSGMISLGRMLAKNGRVDATSCLRRHTTHEKLTRGGDRSKQSHLNTIDVINRAKIKDKIVLLMDDVCTTENSMVACRELLLVAGAEEVYMLALGRTSE